MCINKGTPFNKDQMNIRQMAVGNLLPGEICHYVNNQTKVASYIHKQVSRRKSP